MNLAGRWRGRQTQHLGLPRWRGRRPGALPLQMRRKRLVKQKASKGAWGRGGGDCQRISYTLAGAAQAWTSVVLISE